MALLETNKRQSIIDFFIFVKYGVENRKDPIQISITGTLENFAESTCRSCIKGEGVMYEGSM